MIKSAEIQRPYPRGPPLVYMSVFKAINKMSNFTFVDVLNVSYVIKACFHRLPYIFCKKEAQMLIVLTLNKKGNQ